MAKHGPCIALARHIVIAVEVKTDKDFGTLLGIRSIRDQSSDAIGSPGNGRIFTRSRQVRE